MLSRNSYLSLTLLTVLLVFAAPETRSYIVIQADGTGCPGVWDPLNTTCMLESDVDESIILIDSLTLDCDGYSVNGFGDIDPTGIIAAGLDCSINDCHVKGWDIGLIATDHHGAGGSAKVTNSTFRGNSEFDIVNDQVKIQIFDGIFQCLDDVCPDISIVSQYSHFDEIENNRLDGAGIGIEEIFTTGSRIASNDFYTSVAGVVAVDVDDLQLRKNTFEALPGDDLFAAIYVLGLDDSANNILIEDNYISEYPGAIAFDNVEKALVIHNFLNSANVPFYSAGNQEKVTLKDNTFHKSGAMWFETWLADQFAREIVITDNKFNGQGFESYNPKRNYGIVFDFTEGTDIYNIEFSFNRFQNVKNGAAFFGENSEIHTFANNFLSVDDFFFLAEHPYQADNEGIGGYYGKGVASCDAPSRLNFFNPNHAPVTDDHPAHSIFPDSFESGDTTDWNSCNP